MSRSCVFTDNKCFKTIFFFLSKGVRFLRSLIDSSMTSELQALDFNNQILRRCPPQISPDELDASSVLPKTSASSPRQRLTRQFLKDKSAVCTHANDARPSGKSAGWESVYRGWARGLGRRDNFICFPFCWLSKIYREKKLSYCQTIPSLFPQQWAPRYPLMHTHSICKRRIWT